MDDVIINNFIISKKSVMWNLDYDNPLQEQILQKIKYFKTIWLANKSTRIIMVSLLET